MMTFESFVAILVMGVLSGNLLAVGGVGVETVSGATCLADGHDLDKAMSIKQNRNPYKLGLAVTVILCLAALLNFLVYYEVLVPLGFEFLHILVFMIVIAGLVFGLDALLKKCIPLQKWAPLNALAINSLVLFAVQFVLIPSNMSGKLGTVLLNALFVGLGYLVVLQLVHSIKFKLATAEVPRAFQGLPILLIALGLVAMAFAGLGGLSFGG